MEEFFLIHLFHEFMYTVTKQNSIKTKQNISIQNNINAKHNSISQQKNNFIKSFSKS